MIIKTVILKDKSLNKNDKKTNISTNIKRT